MSAFGLACAVGAVVLFGSNYVPMKRYDVGDGFFFQLMLCAGIWLVGVVIALTRPTARSVEPLAAFGGVVWCTGQLSVAYIVQSIGMAKGLIIWGSTAMLAGWACGVFGLLGVHSQADAIHSWPLNVAGLVLSLLSLIASLFIKPETAAVQPSSSPLSEKLLIIGETVEKTSSHKAALQGTAFALFAGLFFGVNFNGAQYVMDRAGTDEYPHASSHGLDYVPSQFSGVLLASTCYFALHTAIVKRNRPEVRGEIALPALLSGVMWGIADALWFVANEELGFVVAFPIVLSGPGIVASLWGFCFLGELKGCRNAALAALVAALVTSGAALLSLSRL